MTVKNQSNSFRENYQELLNLISEPIMILNREGVLLAANKTLGKFIGAPTEELLGKHFESLNIFNRENQKVIESRLERRLNGENLEDYELALCINGKTKYVEPKGNKIEYLGKDADLIILHDVTKSKQRQTQMLAKIAEKGEQCKKTEDKYLKLFLESTDAIFIANYNGTIVDCNPAASLLVGMKRSELIGKHYDILHAETLMGEEGKKELREQTKSCLANPVETRMITKKGDTKYVSIRISLFEFKGKKFLQGTLRDVTERRLMEQAMQEKEKKFYGITNSVKDAIVLVDEEAKVTYWNPAAEKIFGFLSSEVTGKSIHALVVPNSMCQEGKERIEYSVKIFGETGTGYFTVGNVELIGRRKDGSEFPVELSLSPIKLDGKWSAVGVIKDVSDRKKTEEKTRQVEQRYHTFFNQAPLGVLVVDPETGEFIEYNDFAHSQLGYSREEFSTMSVFDIEAKESPEETRTHLLKLAKTGSGEFETRHRTKNGEIRNVIVTIKAIEFLGKNLFHCVFHDITEIKKIQIELGKYSQKLEDLVEHRTELLKQTQAKLVKSERLAAIGELAGMIGHDLRNPLTGIKNSAYFLKKKGNTIPETQAREMLETIDKCVDYSNKIVNDLLDYSREIHLEAKEYSPRKLLEESLAMVSVPDTIEIVNQIDEKPHLMVDLTKIKRVLINLIKNAVEAMPNVGKLTLYGKKVGGLFEISVADTGPGISDEVLPKLFTPLFTTKAQGMGFGLAICKRIVEAHGGTITVKTATGEGTTFKITLPIGPETEIGGEKIWINIPESSLSTMTKQ